MKGQGLCLTGWWFFPTPLKNDGVKVSWDDDIPNDMENKIMFQTTNHIFSITMLGDWIVSISEYAIDFDTLITT